ncbi:MAG: metallophosphoesterase [Fibrobacter sp.]|nr:metallophosphoesterase [Fibrobacter sp.]
MKKIKCTKTVNFGLVVLLLINVSWSEPWKFGLMGDTQWRGNVDGENPNTVAVGIIKQINGEFISHGVKMVFQVGDLVDVYSAAAFDTRAEAAQELIDAGIGFFPLRGNHEPGSNAANYMSNVFPQTCGTMNTFGATNFEFPSYELECLSYSFDYNNARFVLLDQFTRKDNSGTNHSNNIVDQVSWVTSVLANRAPNTHAFILSHKNLIGQNHMDCLFGSSPASRIETQNALIKAFDQNRVQYYLCGHDHLHHRSIIASPDMNFKIEQLICSSNSYKFYTPRVPSIDQSFNNPLRELPVSQELYTVGYYIFTIDGPYVTVDFYSSLNGCGGTWDETVNCSLRETPQLSFQKRETYGYSLNGKKYVVNPKESLTGISDTCLNEGSEKTRMRIIDGVNEKSAILYDGRECVQTICTGWRKGSSESGNLKSDILSLWGINNEIGNEKGDWFTLELSYNGELTGPLSLVTKDSNGNWIKPSDINSEITQKFIIGKYKEEFGPGSYGIDPQTKTVWAVLNHGGEFAVAQSTDGDQDGDGIVDRNDIDIVVSLRNKPAQVKPTADLDNDGKITVLDVRKLVLLQNR